MDESPTPPSNETPAIQTSTGLTPNVGAGLACVFGILGGIVFLLIEKKNQFIRFWAMQTVVVSLAVFAVSIALSILNAILGALPVIGGVFDFLFLLIFLAFFLGCFALWLAMVIQSFSGKEWRMPYAAKYADRFLKKIPA